MKTASLFVVVIFFALSNGASLKKRAVMDSVLNTGGQLAAGLYGGVFGESALVEQCRNAGFLNTGREREARLFGVESVVGNVGRTFYTDDMARTTCEENGLYDPKLDPRNHHYVPVVYQQPRPTHVLILNPVQARPVTLVQHQIVPVVAAAPAASSLHIQQAQSQVVNLQRN